MINLFDFGAEKSEPALMQLLCNYNPVKAIHENTCYDFHKLV